jgi:NAD(P)-dependent dehydrogenase (short-subunit alcohol dehydrogenase family)
MTATDTLRDLFSIEGKVAVVTGGSRGIGLMIARGFVQAGARVYISSRRGDVCEQVATELSQYGECIPFGQDLSTVEGAERLAAFVAEREPKLDILVNNAGALWDAPLEEYPDSAFDKMWNINVKGVFHLTRLLLPQLRAAATLENPARVIVVGSADAIKVPEWETYGYSASKAGVHMLSRHLAHRLAAEHITVNVISPGAFESKITSGILGTDEGRQEMIDYVPLHRIGTPEEMAGTAIYLASRASGYLTGAIIPIDGGMTTHG